VAERGEALIQGRVKSDRGPFVNSLRGAAKPLWGATDYVWPSFSGGGCRAQPLKGRPCRPPEKKTYRKKISWGASLTDVQDFLILRPEKKEGRK